MRKLKIPNELRRFFNSMFLTIAISFIFFVILNLKGIDGQYDKLFSSIGSVGSIFIGYGAYRISQEQKHNTKFKVSEEERRIIRDHYKKTSEAIAKTSNYWNGRHFNNDAQGKDDPTLQLLELMKSAKIELPDGFSQLIEEIFEFYSNLASQLLDAKKKNIALGDKVLENFKKERELKLELENLYSKYLKIPN